MGVFIVYIFKSAVCLSAFYLFYRLLLSRETFHRFNRFAILGILALSLLIPFCEVSVEQRTEVQQTVFSLEQLLLLVDAMEGTPVVQAQKERTIWVRLIVLVYLAGAVFLVIRNLYSLLRLCILLRGGKRTALDNKIILIVHDRDNLAPFSWMKYVVISRKDFDESGREILIHELAHIRNRHSADLFIADFCIFFQWFNPAAWLLKQELQNIHEYEADEMVIKAGVNAKQYQLLIIKKAVGTRLYSMANSFNHSKLNKRITMMLKEKSSPWAKLKYLYVLPLAAIAVTAFARPEISNELKDLSEVKVNELNAIVTASGAKNEMVQAKDTSEWYVESEEEVRQSRKEAEKASAEVLTGESLNAQMLVKIGDKTDLTIDFTDNKWIRMSGDSATYHAQSIMIMSTADSPSDSIKASNESFNVKLDVVRKEPLVYVDGKEVAAGILSTLNPNGIERIEVLKDQPAIERYGEKAKDGVILITLKKEDK